MSIVMGIDPGVDNGVAIWRDGKLHKLETVRSYQLLSVFELWEPVVVSIEDSRLISKIFTGKNDNTSTEAKRLKIARNVGMVDGVCNMVEDILDAMAFELFMQSPKDKGTKVNKKQFEQITGWTDQSNQHERDAAMVAYILRFKGMR